MGETVQRARLMPVADGARARLLRGVPVLADLSNELLAELAGQLSTRHVPAGTWIMHEGEAADSVFIIAGGRVEIIDEGPPEALVRVLRRGDVLGELALLRRGTRSASARARRDVELLELGRQRFEELIENVPGFALGLTRVLGAQLAASRAPIVAGPPPRSIAVVAIDRGADAGELARQLTASLRTHTSAELLSEGNAESLARAEASVERLVLEVGASLQDDWSQLALSEADLILAVGSGRGVALEGSEAFALRGCELLVFGRGLSRPALDQLRPRSWQVVARAADRGAAVESLARRLAGRSLGLVLSGGGARAFAHLGVLAELRAAGLRFDRVAGVSLGSLVAASAAIGMDFDEAYAAFEHGFVSRNPSGDFSIPAYSLIRGGRTRRLLAERFGERLIEELPLRFFCVSCDLISRETVVHSSGRVVDAVYPSLAIPGVFPPVATSDGRLLVDGGVLDNLPVATMARKGEGPVVAVDVTGRMGPVKSRARSGLARWAGPTRRLLTGSERPIPHLGETVVRSVTVGSIDTVAAARMHADLVISPRVEGTGLVDWKALPRVVELGRQAAREALADPGALETVTS